MHRETIIALVLVGCSAIDDSNTTAPPACAAGPESLGDVRPATPVDYVEVRMGCGRHAEIVKSSGVACATATNASSCKNVLSEVCDTSSSFDDRTYVVFTRGDEVGTIDQPADLVAFLGAIDTEDEAVLVAWMNTGTSTFNFGCTSTLVRATADGGFDLIVRAPAVIPMGCGKIFRSWLHVTAEGALSTIAAEEQGDDCPNAGWW